VIEGCQTDLQQTRFLDYPALQRYCHLVAGVVGEVAANIFGRTQEATVQYAHQLGQAMQLTNIIRDVGDDARRGRVYLPLDELQRFEVKAHELLQRESPWGYSPRFDALMRFQAERAQAAYDAALAAFAQRRPPGAEAGPDDGQHLPHAAARDQAQGFQVLHQRTSLTPVRKLWIAARTHVLAR
jgi:phytoene synthase